MSFVGLKTIFTSLISAEVIEPSGLGFLGNLLSIIGTMAVSLWQAICSLFYTVCMWFLALVDFLQYFIQKLIGLDYWLRDGNKTFEGAIESDLLFSFLYNDTVQNVFRAMMGIFFLLLIVFTIFAIIKQEWTFATGGFEGGDGNSKVKILRNSMKAIALVLVFPLILVIGIISSNAILASLVNALSIDMNQTFGSTLFSIASQTANKYRVYADDENRRPVTQEVTFYVDGKGNTVAYSDGSITGGKYTRYISIYETYLSEINNNCNKHTVNTVFELVNPSKESSFSGYCISMKVDGESKYFMVKCSSSNKTAMYYYLRNQLGANIMYQASEKNTVMAADGQTYRSIHAILKKHMESSGFIRSIDLTNYDQDTALIQACYNTWGYSSVYDNSKNFAVTNEYNVVGSSTLGGYGLGQLSSAKIIYNSNEISSYYDGGQFGVVQKQSEYLVMADVVDFINENGVRLYMIDATSSMIKWNVNGYTAAGTRWLSSSSVPAGSATSTPINIGGSQSLPFIVSYSDICSETESGNVLYTAKYGKNSELDGTVYIMCWKYTDGTTTKYVPLLNNVKFEDPYTQDTYTFKSDYYSGSYTGLVVAKGIFETRSTNASIGEPTYIQTTATTGNANVDSALAGTDDMFYYTMNNRGYMKPYFTDNASSVETYSKINALELSTDFNNITVNKEVKATETLWQAVETVKRNDGTSDIIEKPFNPAMIQALTIRLNATGHSAYANYAEEAFTADDGNTYYLFATSDQAAYFAVSADKENGKLRVLSINASGSIQSLGVETNLEAVVHKYTFHYKYSIDGTSGDETADQRSTIAPKFFEYAKTENGQSIFQTVDQEFINIPGKYQKGMYINASFKTTSTSLIGFDSGAKKITFAKPEENVNSANTYTLAFYKFDLYNYYVGAVGNTTGYTLNQYDIASKDIDTYTGEPGATFEFNIGVNNFSWDSSAESLSLYDGKIYVGTIYKPVNQTINNGSREEIFASLNSATTRILYNGKEYLNMITQNRFTSNNAMKTHYNNVRESLVIGFYRDNAGGLVGSQGWVAEQLLVTDFNVALFGGWRLKMAFAPQKMTNQDMAGYFTLEDGVGFDYFFERSSMEKKNNEGVGFSTFFVPQKVSYWLILIASALIIKILGTSLWGVIKRFYEITLYFVAMPAVASTIVFDDGEKFKSAIQMPLVTKVLSTYGVILGINMFFVLLAPVRSMSNIFTEADMKASGNLFLKYLPIGPKLLNYFVYVMFMLVAFTMIDALPKAISQIVSPGPGGDIAASGKETMGQVGQSMKGAGDMISGRSAINAVKKGAGFAKDMLAPGRALIAPIAGKAKNFLKGDGEDGEGGGKGREGDDGEDGNAADGSNEAQGGGGGGAAGGQGGTGESGGSGGASGTGETGGAGKDGDNAADGSFEAQNAQEGDPLENTEGMSDTLDGVEAPQGADSSMEMPDGAGDPDAMEMSEGGAGPDAIDAEDADALGNETDTDTDIEDENARDDDALADDNGEIKEGEDASAGEDGADSSETGLEFDENGNLVENDGAEGTEVLDETEGEEANGTGQDFSAVADPERRAAFEAMTDNDVVNYYKERVKEGGEHPEKWQKELGLNENSTDEEILNAINNNPERKRSLTVGAASRDPRFKDVVNKHTVAQGSVSTGSSGGGAPVMGGGAAGGKGATAGAHNKTEDEIFEKHKNKRKHPKLRKALKAAALIGGAAIAGAALSPAALALMAAGGFVGYKAVKGIGRRVKKTIRGAKNLAKRAGRTFKRVGRAAVTGAIAGTAGLAVTALSGGNLVAGAMVAGVIINKRKKAKKAKASSRRKFAEKAGGKEFTQATGGDYTAAESQPISEQDAVKVASGMQGGYDPKNGAPKTTAEKISGVANGTVDPAEVEDAVAVSEYNNQAVQDNDVVDDVVGARANVVKNRVGSKVGRLVAARALADYGEDAADEDASMSDKVETAINGKTDEDGNVVQAGLLKNNMKLQAIRSVLKGKEAEDFDAMTAEEQEAQLASYNVGSNIGLDGKIGFNVSKLSKDANGNVVEGEAIAVEENVSNDIVAQMLSSDSIGEEGINLAIDEMNAGSKIDAALAQNLSLGVDYTSEDASSATSLLSKSIYDKASQDDDIVAEAMLRHIESNKDSQLYQDFQRDFGLTDTTDLSNPTDRQRVIEQIKMHKKNGDERTLIGGMKPDAYASELTSVVQEKVQDGSFKVTAWDMADKETRAQFKQKTSANLNAIGSHSILNGASEKDQNKILANTAVSIMNESGTTGTNKKIQDIAFAANVSAADIKELDDGGKLAGLVGKDKTAENLTATDKQFLGFAKQANGGNLNGITAAKAAELRRQFKSSSARIGVFASMSEEARANAVKKSGQEGAVAQMATQDATRALDSGKINSLEARFVKEGNVSNPIVAQRLGERYEQYARENKLANTSIDGATEEQLGAFLKADTLSSNLVMREMKNDNFDFTSIANNEYNAMYARTKDEQATEEKLSTDAVRNGENADEAIFKAFAVTAPSKIEGKSTIANDIFAKYTDIETSGSAGYKTTLATVKKKFDAGELATFMNGNGLSEQDVVTAYKKAEFFGETSKESFGVGDLKKFTVQSDATDTAMLKKIAADADPATFKAIAADLRSTSLTQEQEDSLVSGIAKRGYSSLTAAQQKSLEEKGYKKEDLKGLSYFELTQRAEGKSSEEVYKQVKSETDHARNVEKVFETQGGIITNERIKESIDSSDSAEAAEAASFVADAYAGKMTLLSQDEQADIRRTAAIQSIIGESKANDIATSEEGKETIARAQTHAVYKELETNHAEEVTALKKTKEYKAAAKEDNFNEEEYVVNALEQKVSKDAKKPEAAAAFARVKTNAREDAIIDLAMRDDASLGAQIVAKGQDEIELANKRRIAQVLTAENNAGKATRVDLYADAISSNAAMYNKANIAFRAASGGKDLSDVDVMTRNNFLANDFTATLSGQDKKWFDSQKKQLDSQYVSDMVGPDAENLLKKVNPNYTIDNYAEQSAKRGLSIEQALAQDGLMSSGEGTKKVEDMSVQELDRAIASSMSQSQFDAIYNEAKHENFGEEVAVFSNVKKNIISEQLKSDSGLTPAVDPSKMTGAEKVNFNFNKNLIQQSIRNDDNPAILANAFRNTTLIDNDRHVDAIVKGSGKSKAEILKNNSAFVQKAQMSTINSKGQKTLRDAIEKQYFKDVTGKTERDWEKLTEKEKTAILGDASNGERDAIYARYLTDEKFTKKNDRLVGKFNKSVDDEIVRMSTTATGDELKQGLSNEDINKYLKTNEAIKDQLVDHVASNVTLGLDEETKQAREADAVLGNSALTNQVALNMLDTNVSAKGVDKQLLPKFIKTQAKIKQVREDASIRQKLGLKANASNDEIETALSSAGFGEKTIESISSTVGSVDTGMTSRETYDELKKDGALLATLGIDKSKATDKAMSDALNGDANGNGKSENAGLVKAALAMKTNKAEAVKQIRENTSIMTSLGLDKNATDEQIEEKFNQRMATTVAKKAVSHRLNTKKDKTDLERAAISLESGDAKLGHEYIARNATQLKSDLAKDMFFTTDANGNTVLREHVKNATAGTKLGGQKTTDMFNTSVNALKADSKAFNNGLYTEVSKQLDPNAVGSDARNDFFRSQTKDLNTRVGFGNSRAKKKEVNGVSEAFDAFVKDVNGSLGDRTAKGAQALWYKVSKKVPEQSAAYTNWNRVLEKKIQDIKTGGGQYATMSRSAREAEVAKFEKQKIDTTLPANFDNMSPEEQRAYKEQQLLLKHEAITTGNISSLYKTGTKVTSPKKSNAIKRFADNAGYSLGFSGTAMSEDVKNQHKQDLTDIDGKIARYNATKAMRNKNVDFGANFNTFVNNYLDNRQSNTVINQSNKQFLDKFKGQVDKNGKKIDKDFKFGDLTVKQQEALIQTREDTMATHMNKLHQVASKKVAKDAGLNPTTYLEEKGIETQNVRYKDGSKKYTHVQSKIHIPGVDKMITNKRIKDIKAYEEEYDRTGGEVSEKTRKKYQKSFYGKRSLESAVQNQNRSIELQKQFDKVTEFNRNFKGTSTQYAAAFKAEFGPLADQLYAKSNGAFGKVGRKGLAKLENSPVAVQQRDLTNGLIKEIKKTSDRMKYGSAYIPATSDNSYAYVGKTMSNAKTRMEVELDRKNAADASKEFKQFNTDKSMMSYDSLFARLKPGMQEAFNKQKGKKFDGLSEADKKDALSKFLAKEVERTGKIVHNNNFLRTDSHDLQKLNGIYVQRDRVNNSGVSRTMIKALSTNESKIYQNVVNNYNSAKRKLEEEQKHMGRLGSALTEVSSGVQSSGTRNQAKKIKEQIETSSVRLSVLKKEYEQAAARKNEFEHRIIETKVAPTQGGPVGYNNVKVRNIFNDYRFPRRDGKGDIEPDSIDGKKLMWAVAYFMRRNRSNMDRLRLDLESMVNRSIIQESSRLNARMNALIKRQSDNFGKTIRDLIESRNVLKEEIKRLETSTDAKDVRLRNELQNHYTRIDNEYEKLVKELGDVDVAISSISATAKKKK